MGGGVQIHKRNGKISTTIPFNVINICFERIKENFVNSQPNGNEICAAKLWKMYKCTSKIPKNYQLIECEFEGRM